MIVMDLSLSDFFYNSECSIGLFIRMIGLVYAVCLGSFAVQLPLLAGVHGLEPLHSSLATKWRHFGLKALWYYPTLFWLFGSSDFMLKFLPSVGALCGLLMAYGSSYTPCLSFVCWVILLSIDAGPSHLVYPWDSLLLETGFLCLWLPGTLSFTGSLASLAALSPPSPILSFSLRWLTFRLLIGFGKLKFIGSGWKDRFYIRGFLINQPMVSPLGWWAHHALPEWAWVVSLGYMAVVELVCPFGFFWTGIPRVVASVSISSLMLGIWATGNYGYFNILTVALCVGSMDLGSSARLTFTSADFVPPGSGPLFVEKGGSWALSPRVLSSPHMFPSLFCATVLLFYIFPISLLQFVMNSWINLSWAYWGGVYRLKVHPSLLWTQFLARVLRFSQQFRLVSGYGVFPPHASPPQRWALCYEGSKDGVHWERYEYAHYLSSSRTPPAFIAPYHPRLDHAIFYESFGSAGFVARAFIRFRVKRNIRALTTHKQHTRRAHSYFFFLTAPLYLCWATITHTLSFHPAMLGNVFR